MKFKSNKWMMESYLSNNLHQFIFNFIVLLFELKIHRMLFIDLFENNPKINGEMMKLEFFAENKINFSYI